MDHSALDCLFDTLKTHGRNFTPDFWRIVCTTVLFPIFSILSAGDTATSLTPNPLETAVVPPLLTIHNQGSNGSAAPEDPPATPGVTDVKTFRFRNPEELSVWLSTTLISALREMIDLYTFYFGVMQEFLEGLLDILVACICQGESHGLRSRIMLTCNRERHARANRHIVFPAAARVQRPQAQPREVGAHRQRICAAVPDHHRRAALRPCPGGREGADRRRRRRRWVPCRIPSIYVLTAAAPFQKFVAPAPLAPSSEKAPSLPETLSYAEQRKIFKQIIVKCVLQLLLIETTHGLLQNDDVYNTIPAEHLLRFMGVLDNSWRFARKFNADRDLRMKLWKVGESSGYSRSYGQGSFGRIHEAATESAEAGVERGGHANQVLLRMYRDPREAHRATRSGVLERLVPYVLSVAAHGPPS